MSTKDRTYRYTQLATRIAEQGSYGGYKHGAVLVKGGSIINTSSNKDKFCSFGARFRNPNEGIATLHAELGCILNLDRSVTKGTTIYVVRVNRDGKLRMSKPCSMCSTALEHVGVKKVFYSNKEGEIDSYKL
jgi:tRNA(Arg) A34 adenosine deaminase TadA